MELLLFIIAGLAAGAVLLVRSEKAKRTSWLLVAAGTLFVCIGLGAKDTSSGDWLREALPERHSDEGFVSSSTCRSCHPGEYHSWHDSFHRSMTQEASVETVVADFDDVQLEDREHATRMFRRGDEYWVEMDDPGWFSTPVANRAPQPLRVEMRVVMTTGSHHLQNYWVLRSRSDIHEENPEDGVLLQVPWVWLIDAERWAPTQDSFLAPDTEEPQVFVPWITSCNGCHSVGTQPRFGTKFDASRTVELGIACEACHGPGAEHVEAYSSPWRRYDRHLADAADDSTGTGAEHSNIINPANLSKERSAEVCGQCHSYHRERDQKRWNQTGGAFRAGDELADTKTVLRHVGLDDSEGSASEVLRLEAESQAGMFWDDGTIRVAGREFNGLIESACYTRGEMTCLSCHSMHDYDAPKDQLASQMSEDESCLQCHSDFRGQVEEHTHHDVDSVGSRCMNCHMPHTTFGLFVAMRSHRVDSPDLALSIETERPNACNQCHLDQPFRWTAEKLSEWYGHEPVQLDRDQEEIAAGVLWALEGDAAQRAILAWSLGRPAAQETTGTDWQGFLLAGLLNDSYAATRRVAYRSLRTLPGFESFEYDYIAPPEERELRSAAALALWAQGAQDQLDRHGPHLLLDASGERDLVTLRRLLSNRDETPVTIVE